MTKKTKKNLNAGHTKRTDVRILSDLEDLLNQKNSFMNLNNFESQLSSTILQRGKEYYNKGYITDLQKLRSGEWISVVEGNYGDYNVEIAIDADGNINSYFCNCPYEGEMCKHIAAVLLKVKGISNEETQQDKHKPEWEDIIQDTPEAKLREFLFDYAKENKNFRNALSINFPAENGGIDPSKYARMVSQAFTSAGDRYGFIDYKATYTALKPVFGLLSQAENHIEKGNYTKAFNITSAIAPECISAIEYIDDSDGECGDAITEAFNCVSTIIELTTDETLRQAIFDWVCNQFENPNYSDYGCDDGLEGLFINASKMVGKLEKPYAIIEENLKRYADADNWSRSYNYKRYLGYKIELLRYEGRIQEAEQIIDDNIELDNFRQIRVEELLKKQEYQKAIELIKKCITISERNDLPGVTKSWKEQLLEINSKISNTNEVRKISKELFLNNTYSIEFYRIYKSTFSDENWDDACNNLIEEIKPKKKNSFTRGFASDLAAIYIEEKMWSKLLDIVKQSGNIRIIAEYTEYLNKDFTPALLPLYQKGIIEMAEQTGGGIYQDLVVYLKKLSSLKGGKNVAISLKNSLLETYKNRSAMKDEFKTLKW